MTDINWVAGYIGGELKSRYVQVCALLYEQDGGVGLAPVLSSYSSHIIPCSSVPLQLMASHDQLGKCAFHTAGWPHCRLPRHVSFLSCLLAGPPQGLLSTVVLWKVSASHSTLWPDVVIRNSYKKRQNTQREGGGWGPQAAAQNMPSLIPRVTETDTTLLPSHPI